jgi:hypothetical protein
LGVLQSSAFLRPLLGKHGGFLKSFLGLLVSLGRVFHRLFRRLVSALVIFLAVMRCGNTMNMCGKIVQLSGSLVRVFWHDYPRTANLTVTLCRMNVHAVEYRLFAVAKSNPNWSIAYAAALIAQVRRPGEPTFKVFACQT